MKEDKKVPQLRFPEFTDAWKQRKLREVVKEFYNGKTPYRQNKAYWGGNVNWLTSGDLNRDVVTNTIEKITEEGQKASRLRIIPKGTLVIAIMGLEAAGTRGNCGILGIDTTINQACMALIANESIATKDFLFQWYKAFGNRLALKFTQGTKQQNYNEELLGNLDISYPSLKEQQQIGAFFTQLDNTITLQQRKLNSLQKLKKGLLQKMFPKNGENIPEIRFPEFSDAWKQRKFSEVFEEYSEKKHPELPALTIIQGKGTILRDASDRNLLYDKANLASYKLVRKDDFIVHLRTFEGGLEKANSDGIVSPAYHIFHGKNTDTRFFYPFFRSKYFIDALLKPHVYGIRDGKSIDIEGMKTISFLVPSFEEQNKIGKFVETLDNTITLQQRKLESLQKLKKGLLQQMFI